MFRSTTLALLCLAASPALAQNQTAPAQSTPAAEAPAGPPPEVMQAIQQAGMAFGQCVNAAVPGVPASVTPEAGAASVLAGCSTQRAALDRAAQALIAAIPEAQRSIAQAQIRGQLDSIPTQVADGIRQSRGAAAPAATPAH
jgi:hypothetical protein